MNPIRFSEIINDLPDEFIESAADPHYAKESRSGLISAQHPDSEQAESRAEHEAIRQTTKQVTVVPEKSHSDISAPRWITAAATAASLLFAVGIGAVIMSGTRHDISTYSADDSIYTHDITDEILTEITTGTAVSGTETAVRTTTSARHTSELPASVTTQKTDKTNETTQQPATAEAAAETPQTDSEAVTAAPTEPVSSAAVTSVPVTTTTEPVIVPDIVLQYCQTLEDGLPLWVHERSISYHDGLDFTVFSVAEDKRVLNTEPFRLKGMYAEVGCAKGAPGETVTIPVYLAGVPDLSGLLLFLNAPEELELTEITSSAVADFILNDPEREPEVYPSYECNPSAGSLLLVLGNDIQLPDGYVIATYSYRIPEDAQPGTVYPVRVNPAKSCCGCMDGKYQYTLLDGVIAVEASGESGT